MPKQKKTEISYEKLTPVYFKRVIELANKVHGDGYLNEQSMIDWAARGMDKTANTCSYVAVLKNSLTPETEHIKKRTSINWFSYYVYTRTLARR